MSDESHRNEIEVQGNQFVAQVMQQPAKLTELEQNIAVLDQITSEKIIKLRHDIDRLQAMAQPSESGINEFIAWVRTLDPDHYPRQSQQIRQNTGKNYRPSHLGSVIELWRMYCETRVDVKK
jgi:hypothetical protein